MPNPQVNISMAVKEQVDAAEAKVSANIDRCLALVRDSQGSQAVHDIEQSLLGPLMALATSLIALWFAVRLPKTVPVKLTHGQASYRFRTLAFDAVRTRFGEFRAARPIYERLHGEGPATLAPHDGVVGLADGRMSSGVHLLVGFLAAMMPFDQIVEVLSQFAGYVPSKRSMLGIVDVLGPSAEALMKDMPAPEDDGEVLVIQADDKGAGMISKREHARRCRPHTKGGSAGRGGRRKKRLANPRPRKKKGEKSKNARMSKVFVIYTLRRTKNGKLEGPLNKRVIASFGERDDVARVALAEAQRRGYGVKESYFLADGSKAIWRIHASYFPDATPCTDWYHVSEYLWTAGGAVHAEGSSELSAWVQACKEQLRKGQIDALFASLQKHRAAIPKRGPGTKSRRARVDKAIGYLTANRERLRYDELLKVDMDIATGAVEGAVNHVVGLRLDGSMMRWTMRRANHVLALRCLVVSDLWRTFETRVREAHKKRGSPVIGRVTPQAPQTPYDAQRKAA